MPPYWQSILLFIPLFFAINLVAAIPGRRNLNEIFKVGFRQFLTGSVVLLVACSLLFLLMGWLTGRAPLF